MITGCGCGFVCVVCALLDGEVEGKGWEGSVNWYALGLHSLCVMNGKQCLV